MRMEGKLTNAGGEFIASGPCEVNRDRREVTMWPSWELHMLERERGELSLELEDGSRLAISDRHLTFKLRGTAEQRISVYRLRILDRPSVPEHLAAGYSAPAAAEEPAASIEAPTAADPAHTQAAPPA
ncbi:MAG TPA: hypothetical protein VEZ14_00790 [Dehalococcoidia bacterium]|nr:hypothetical protein [Dehalococcoidia bacterium]